MCLGLCTAECGSVLRHEGISAPCREYVVACDVCRIGFVPVGLLQCYFQVV